MEQPAPQKITSAGQTHPTFPPKCRVQPLLGRACFVYITPCHAVKVESALGDPKRTTPRFCGIGDTFGIKKDPVDDCARWSDSPRALRNCVLHVHNAEQRPLDLPRFGVDEITAANRQERARRSKGFYATIAGATTRTINC
jgi:hypothetical protein